MFIVMNREQRARVVRRALAATLQHLREQRRIAQETLAIESDLGRSHMSSLERGVGNPTIITIDRLLPLLGVNFEKFGAELDRHLRVKAR